MEKRIHNCYIRHWRAMIHTEKDVMKSSIFWDIKPCSPLRVSPVILFLSPLGSLGLCESQWVLAFHSVLRASQREPICCPKFSSCFLHNQKFREVHCSACHLLSLWFLAWLFLRPWRWRWPDTPKRRLTSNRLHGVITTAEDNLKSYIGRSDDCDAYKKWWYWLIRELIFVIHTPREVTIVILNHVAWHGSGCNN
jgi:hypothetical protein